MSTIVRLSGTSGAGKSTVAHTLLKVYPFEVVEYFGAKGTRPLVYRVRTHCANDIFMFGTYNTQCGGCDAIMDYKTIVPKLLDKYIKEGDVLFEGLLIGCNFGAVGEHMHRLHDKGHNVQYAFMDTPLELCLERINERRRNRGVGEPVNPKQTEQKYRSTISTFRSIQEKGLNAVKINHKRPVREVLALFGINILREPKHATFADH